MHDFAIVILSCDKYGDLWTPFMSQLRRQFPSAADYPVYFGSNEVACREEGVIPVLSGKDRDWSSSFRSILQQVPARKVLVLLEDLMMATPVDPDVFRQCVAFVDRHDARHLKYWNQIKTDSDSDDPAFGVLRRGAPYRATVAAFWDREYLLRLLLDGENPWNFEIMGSYRTSYSDGFYGMKQSLFEFVNLVEKGHWIADSLRWAEEAGISLEVSRRPALTGKRGAIASLQMLYFRWMIRVPWPKRLAWMQKLRRALICY